MTAALDGIAVIDISESIAGQYCTRLMADMGASVVLAEPDGGSVIRQIGPFDKDGASFTFLHLNHGKKVQHFGAGEIAQHEFDLARSVDIVVCGENDRAEHLRGASDRLIVVKITPFGDDGPHKGWQAPEIVLQAQSGMMNNNGVAGREPLYGVGNRASYAAGVAGYIGALAALHVREQSGAGDTVRVDVAETAASMCFPYVQQTFYNGTDRRRGDQDIPAGQVLCSGSWVCIWVYNNRFATLCDALGLENCKTDPRFARHQERAGNWNAFFELVQEKVADRDPEAFVAELQELQIIAARAYRPSELRESPHLAARGYWRRITVGGCERVLLGPSFRITRAADSPIARQPDGARP